MDKRAIAIKRKNLPLFEKLGVLSQPSVDLLLSEFSNTESSFDSAVALRNSNKHTWGDLLHDNKLDNYDQYDIQYCGEITRYDDPDYDLTESDYVYYDSVFEPVVKELTATLGSDVRRLRYATLEPGAVLDWHMDQPNYDRFICVLKGTQRYEVLKRKEPHHCVQSEAEIWYINSNWEHRVLNMQNEIRVALLGCFVYNKG